MRRPLAHLLPLLTLLALPGAAPACGFESGPTLALGLLNFAYPDALHVDTAVWQARARGVLPPADPAERDPAREGMVRLWQALRTLDAMRQRLGGAREAAAPPLAIVLLPAVMWSRLAPGGSDLVLQSHTNGPESGDLVLVTATDALQAWLDGRLDAETLRSAGLLRIYGETEAVDTTWRWLHRANKANP